ncbi:histone-lysine N-methyltransferase SETMAR [Trichonephila inaurata madagascariensis]|uniref:Histone-lysine N-methyltransferase SETMAR n=1 Tax=Trichonephila inaurata madagascariensis TaxID=2747483 RepID=A0A8X6YNT0_9ARAC|nr:histone-lysine N-methyltransferase SETMAR [Trichonephila inaurata madagascariensis]
MSSRPKVALQLGTARQDYVRFSADGPNIALLDLKENSMNQRFVGSVLTSIPLNQQYRTCVSIIKVILYKCGLETAHFYSKVEKIITCECNFKAQTGRPQALDDEALQAAIGKDSGQMCGALARQFNTSSETVRLHLHCLGKMYRLSKWVPHTLFEVHKQQRVAACLSLLCCHRSPSIFNRVLTSEKWVLFDTPKRSKHWLSPQDTVPHSTRPPMHPCKSMLCVWWTSHQVTHYELLQTVARNTIQPLSWETLCHPTYSSILAPSDYHLFHSLDNHLRGKSFTNEADRHQALTDFFASHAPEFYRKSIEQLETLWQKVLDADGDYFKE